MESLELEQISPARLARLLVVASEPLGSAEPLEVGEPSRSSALGPAGRPPLSGYSLLGRIGQGSGGVVWRALQLSTGRLVALKLLNLPVGGSHRAKVRFEREVELTARLRHPDIACVYESRIDRHAPFYAMELIDGLPLDQYVRRQGLTRERILRLMARICRAVQYAHEQGVIHRDLKPSNILVSADGAPHVLDFGLARALFASEGDSTLTLQGEVAGTLGFMSPQQACGATEAVDTRADVYSLGAILYLLLTGSPPYDLSGALHETLGRIAEGQVRPPRQICPDLGAETEALLLKALAREPERRYAMAGALADDIERLLRGDPLAARPPSLRYLLGRRLRKHRLAVAAAAMGLLSVAGLASFAYTRITLERNRAQASERNAQFERAAAQAETRLAQQRLAEAQIAEGNALGGQGQWVQAKVLYRQALLAVPDSSPIAADADLCLLKAYQFAPPPLNVLVGHQGPATAAAFSSDGWRALTGGADRTVRLWDLPTGRLLRCFLGHQDVVTCLAFAPDGRTALSGSRDGTIRLWDLQTGRQIRRAGCSPTLTRLAFSRDGRRAVFCAADGQPVSWDLQGEHQILSQATGTATWSGPAQPTGADPAEWLSAVGGILYVWDGSSGAVRRQWHAHADMVGALAVSADGALCASGAREVDSAGGNIRIWRTATGERAQAFAGHLGGTERLAFNPAGTQLLSSGQDGVVHIWTLGQSASPRTVWGDDHPLKIGAFSPDRQLALCCGADGTVQLCDLRDQGSGQAVVCQVDPPLRSMAVSRDGRYLAVGGRGAVQVFEASSRTLVRVMPVYASTVQAVDFSEDGQQLLFGTSLGDVYLAALNPNGGIRRLGAHDADVRSVAFCPGCRLAVSINGNGAKLWDLGSGQQVGSTGTQATLNAGLGLAADGRTGWAMTVHGRLMRYDLPTGRGSVGPQFNVPRDLSSNAVFLGNPPRVVFACHTTILVCDVTTGATLLTLGGHAGRVRSLAISPSGRQLASGSEDGLIKLWDLSGGTERQTLPAQLSPVISLAYSPAGDRLYSATEDGTVKQWELDFPARCRAFEAALPHVRHVLAENPTDSQSLELLADWYSARRLPAWARSLRARMPATPSAPH